MSKTALVISGGGSKGAFAVGVLQHLVLDLGIDFDLVAGTSTGSAIAPLVVTDEVPELVRIYSSVSTADILAPRPLATAFLDNDSLYDSRPFWNLLGAPRTTTTTRISRSCRASSSGRSISSNPRSHSSASTPLSSLRRPCAGARLSKAS